MINRWPDDRTHFWMDFLSESSTCTFWSFRHIASLTANTVYCTITLNESLLIEDWEHTGYVLM